MNRSGSSLGGAVATSLALLAVTGCGAAPDATEQPAASAGTSLAAEIARQNAETERALHLLVRLELSDDELFEIYEPAPGQFVLSGAGASSNPVLLPEDVDNLTIEQIWRRVARSRPMPESLVAALRQTTGSTALVPPKPGPRPPPKLEATRTFAPGGDIQPRELVPAQSGPRPPPVMPASSFAPVDHTTLLGVPGPRPPPKLEAASSFASVGNSALLVGPGPIPPPKKLAVQALDTVSEAAWCNVGYYELGYGQCPPAATDCVDYWSSDRRTSVPNAAGSYSNVCAVEGNVRLEITSGERYRGVWNVPQNTVRWSRNLQRSPQVGESLNASGGRFHFRYLVGDSGH